MCTSQSIFREKKLFLLFFRFTMIWLHTDTLKKRPGREKRLQPLKTNFNIRERNMGKLFMSNILPLHSWAKSTQSKAFITCNDEVFNIFKRKVFLLFGAVCKACQNYLLHIKLGLKQVQCRKRSNSFVRTDMPQ